MLVVGVDPGVANLGLSALFYTRTEVPVLLATSRIKSPEPFEAAREVARWVSKYDPALVAVEDVLGPMVGATRSGKTNGGALGILAAMGAAVGAAEFASIASVGVTPAFWKSCLGVGSAAKAPQYQRAVAALLGLDTIGPDQAAAVGVALGGARKFRGPAFTQGPKE